MRPAGADAAWLSRARLLLLLRTDLLLPLLPFRLLHDHVRAAATGRRVLALRHTRDDGLLSGCPPGYRIHTAGRHTAVDRAAPAALARGQPAIVARRCP